MPRYENDDKDYNKNQNLSLLTKPDKLKDIYHLLLQKYGKKILIFPEGFSYTVCQPVHDSFYQQYHKDPPEWNERG